MSSFSFPPWLSHPVPPEFVRKYSDPFIWCVRASAGNEDLDRIVHDPDIQLAAGAWILKTSDHCTLGLVGRYVIKRWDCRGIGERLKTLGRRPRSERAGLHALALEWAGLATAPVLAWGERRRYGLAGWSYLVMEYLADGIDLGQWRGDRLPVMDAVGDLIGRLHQQGFTHRDLKPSNVLIGRDGRPSLIDLDGLRLAGQVSPARASVDVLKLGRRMVELSTLSPREAACFVTRYCLARKINRRLWWASLKTAAGRYQEFQMIRTRPDR